MHRTERRVISLTAFGYSLVLLLVLGLGAVTATSLQRLAGITDELYDHPFQVSNAAIGAQAMVALIRNQMLELALVPSAEHLSAAKTRTKALDAGLRERLRVVKQQFLGDPAKIDEIIRRLDEWRQFREEVFALMEHGQTARAIEWIQTDGAGQFDRTYGSVDVVVNQAQNRAVRFRQQAATESREVIALTLLLLAGLALLIALIGWATGRRTMTIIGQERLLMQALEESERRFLKAMDNAPIGVALMNADGQLQRVNQAFSRLLGHPSSELLRLQFLDLTEAVDYDHHARHFRTLSAEGGNSYQLELRLQRRDGSQVWTRTHCSAVRDEGGRPSQVIAQVEDISAHKSAMERDRYLAGILDNVFDGILTIDELGIIDSFNRAAERIFGYRREEVLGRNVKMLVPAPHDALHDDYIQRYLATGEKKIIGIGRVVEGLRKDGSRFPMDLAVTEIREGGKIRFTGILRDITDRVKAEEEVRRMAHHDNLTGLPNRLLLQDRLQRCLARAQRDQTRVALLFLDLDRFKKINDSLGHDIGDELLKTTARRLLACVRESDTVARMGGDEFIIILPLIGFLRDAERVAQKILEAMEEPCLLADEPLTVSTSIGIAVYPDHGSTQQELFRSADMAMYQAKKAGRATYHVHSGAGPAWRYSAAIDKTD
ncbi:MAG: diguanylate cyclase [Methylococcaceae bacterium]|nr:diguanylate cyclase [Methylococcaceae bacterium]